MTKPTINTRNAIISIDFDSVRKCMGYCTTEEGDITKDFYDWYLRDSEFPLNQGLLMLKKEKSDKDYLYVVEFDLTDPEEALFDVSRFGSKRKMSALNFYREENLTMQNISIELNFLIMDEFNKVKDMLWTKEDLAKAERESYYNAKQSKFTTRREGMRKAMPVARRIAAESSMKQVVYIFYSTMFYMINREPEYTEKSIQRPELRSIDFVPAEYKYNGFVNINKKSVITIDVDRDPSLPKRDYTRHIGSWTVRGHYRRINGKLVWIQPHIRGEGPLEQRVYGDDESEARNVKVFKVWRKKHGISREADQEVKHRLVDYIRRFINFFKSA